MKKKFKKENIIIIALSLFLLFFVVLVEKNKTLVKDSLYKEKYEAAKLMEKCIEEIKREKKNRDIEIDVQYDINSTGIIGAEFNGITTTLGALEAKRTSANPNFAAVMVDLIKEAGLNKGDNVAVNFSSSFPALNIATISACEVLGVNPIIITSIGSSTWGGNNLEFTYLDMEEFLFQKGLINYKSKAISPGGAGDIGKDMDKEDLDIIINRMKNYGKEIIIEENLQRNIKTRYDLYYQNIDKIHGFINVGGNIVAFGNTTDSMNISPGVLKDKNYEVTDKTGLVQLFYSKGVSIIHILNIKELAHRYGMEIDPKGSFIVGKGDVYYAYKYPIKWILIVVIMSIILLIIFRKRTRITYD